MVFLRKTIVKTTGLSGSPSRSVKFIRYLHHTCPNRPHIDGCVYRYMHAHTESYSFQTNTCIANMNVLSNLQIYTAYCLLQFFS